VYDKIVLLPTARVYNSFIITILLDFFKKSEWISSGPSDQATRTVIAKYWLLPDRSDCVTQPRTLLVILIIMVTVVVYYIFCLLFTKGVALLALVLQTV
jgi:hypothetical protein